MTGQMNTGISATGLLLYRDFVPSSQFTCSTVLENRPAWWGDQTSTVRSGCRLTGGIWLFLAGDPAAFPQWSSDGRELFSVSPENKLMAVSLKMGAASVESSAPRELFLLPIVDTLYSPYGETAPDGQRFLVRANLPALLKKAAAP